MWFCHHYEFWIQQSLPFMEYVYSCFSSVAPVQSWTVIVSLSPILCAWILMAIDLICLVSAALCNNHHRHKVRTITSLTWRYSWMLMNNWYRKVNKLGIWVLSEDTKMDRAMGKCHKWWSMMWSVTSLSRTSWACVPMEWKRRNTLKKNPFQYTCIQNDANKFPVPWLEISSLVSL